MSRDISFLKDTLIAHRGYHNKEQGIPENSMPAFIEAINKNIPIELDVHITKDNEIVVFHDDNLLRITGRDSNIEELSYKELKRLRLQNTKERIPLLRNVLSKIDGKVPLLLEFKNSMRYKLLVDETMNLLKNYPGKYAVQSFYPYILMYIKKKYPDVIRGQLSSDFNNKKIPIIRKVLYKNMFFNFFTKPDFISYDVRAIPSKRVEKEKKKTTVLGWTVKSSSDLERYKGYCDNFICENINLEKGDNYE